MNRTAQWIPVLKSYFASSKHTSYMELLKSLQNKAKKVKLFSDMSKQQIIKKLHRGRKTLLKENPHAYIDYTA